MMTPLTNCSTSSDPTTEPKMVLGKTTGVELVGIDTPGGCGKRSMPLGSLLVEATTVGGMTTSPGGDTKSTKLAVLLAGVTTLVEGTTTVVAGVAAARVRMSVVFPPASWPNI